MKRYTLLPVVMFSALLLASGVALAAAGDLDKTFGTGGKLVAPYGSSSSARTVAVQPDGKVVVAGSASFGGDRSTRLLVRYERDGTLDRGFGESGKVSIPDLYVADLKLQPDGKIVVAGTDFAVRRYNPNGRPDASFGDGGRAAIEGARGYAQALAFQKDGKIVLAGNGPEQRVPVRTTLVRYGSEGSPDDTFGRDGRLVVAVSGQKFGAYALAVQRDDRLLTAGVGCEPDGEKVCGYSVARFRENGRLDTSFGGDGQATVDTEGKSRAEQANGLAVQPNGRIVVSGYSFRGGRYDFVAAGFTPEGDLDKSFSGDGRVFVSPEPKGRANGLAWDVALQGSKIVIAGSVCCNHDFAVVRLNADGAIDRSFGEGGTAVAKLSGGDDVAYDVAVGRDGKIVAAGFATVFPDSGRTGAFGLARYRGRIRVKRGRLG